MKSIVVCVDYHELLAVTLPRMSPHCELTVVVTKPDQRATIYTAYDCENVEVHTTDVFTDRGAVFNKGAAIEEALDVVGRDGWLVIWDADVLLPDGVWFEEPTGERLDVVVTLSHIPTCVVHECYPGNLYVPRRRICEDPKDYVGQRDWSHWPRTHEAEKPGYFQIFHADDPRLINRRPWYGVDWRHAGGCDSDFQAIWSEESKHWLDHFDVLHLGKTDRNWWGVDGQRNMIAMYENRRRNARRGQHHTFDWEKLQSSQDGYQDSQEQQED